MDGYDPEVWHDFAIALVSASAALCGLAFVAISFNLEAILKEKWLPGRAAETLVFLAGSLIGGLLFLLPPQPREVLGVELLAFALGLAFILFRLGLPRFLGERDSPLSWQLTHILPSLVGVGLCLVGAVGVLTASMGGLYPQAAALVLLMVAGLLNCWVLLVEIKR